MASAVNVASDCPWNRGILYQNDVRQVHQYVTFEQGERVRGEGVEKGTRFQTMTFSAGTYLALPNVTLQSTFAVLSGVGILMTTLFADNFG